MYTLYYFPDACSLATQVVLHELGQAVEIIDKQAVDNFSAINPVGTVPVLVDNGTVLTEGAAVLLYLLDKHHNTMLPKNGEKRVQAIENILFANATMHPTYSRLFFIAQNITDINTQKIAFESAANSITHLWQVVEQKLESKPFLGGEIPSVADIMLTVYSRWGASFPVDITMGERTKKMLTAVLHMPNFERALAAEKQQSAT
jgi:glutathione S-transferase